MLRSINRLINQSIYYCLVDDADLQPWHGFVRVNMKLFGIVSFYFAIFVYNVFDMVSGSRCLDATWACADADVRRERLTDLLYPMVRTVYLCVELVFCVRFNAAVFCQTRLLLAGLAVVQVTI